MIKVLVALMMHRMQLLSDSHDDERGQGTLEYVGMIIVAAGIVVAVLQAAGAIDLGAVFTEAVGTVTGGGGGGEGE